jgi:hypothetical protein
VTAFTDVVLSEAEECIGEVVGAFRSFVEETGREPPRSDPEYVFECLTLGVLWRIYGRAALGLADAPRRMLTGLVRLRQQGGWLKLSADRLRGVLATLFLSADGRSSAGALTMTLDHLDQLLGWLGATEVFGEEVKRLSNWRDFLAELPPHEATAAMVAAVEFAAWFEGSGENALGRYTPNVERFLAETHPRYRWQEDAIFCGRRPVEYHLNMVGTEILNRAFRESFLGTVRKVVLLPPCMKARPDDECQARSTPLGARCASCTPGCRVRQVTELGEELGFEVFILPEELRVFSGETTALASSDEVGIVGVSCVLTNASGGWETRRLGIPAQGVLLDYCGCSYHWHRDGIPTDINDGQLLQVLGIDEDRQPEVGNERARESTLELQ